MESLIDFLLNNIYKFRKLFNLKETYYIDVPENDIEDSDTSRFDITRQTTDKNL